MLGHEGRAWGPGDGRARVRGTDSGDQVRVGGGSGGRTWVRGRGGSKKSGFIYD